MKIPSMRSKEKYLDGGFLYEYYFKTMGTARSQAKLPAVAELNGMVNSMGKSPSIMGCWKAMWRWAMYPENHQRAYELYNEALQDFGKFITFEEFKDVLRKQAKSAIQFRTDGHRQRFFRRYKLDE